MPSGSESPRQIEMLHKSDGVSPVNVPLFQESPKGALERSRACDEIELIRDSRLHFLFGIISYTVSDKNLVGLVL